MRKNRRVLVTGAAGLLGARLCADLARAGRLGTAPIERLIMTDVAPLPSPAAAACAVEVRCEDLTSPDVPARLASLDADVIVHLAATIEGEAETRFEAGYAINFDAARALCEAIRARGGPAPRMVAASSIAVFDAPLPPVVGDEFQVQPLSSYGAQKAMTELLLCDYARKGWIDALAPRLATVAVRPGPPRAGASAFFSTIVSEPLRGARANAPVGLDVRHWLASPGVAVAQLLHAATMDTRTLGDRRALTMPGVSASVGELVAGLARIGGAAAPERLSFDIDPALDAMFRGGPACFDTHRALRLGFPADANLDAILRAYVDETRGATP